MIPDDAASVMIGNEPEFTNGPTGDDNGLVASMGTACGRWCTGTGGIDGGRFGGKLGGNGGGIFGGRGGGSDGGDATTAATGVGMTTGADGDDGGGIGESKINDAPPS